MNGDEDDELVIRLRKWAAEASQGDAVAGVVERVRSGGMEGAGLLDWLEFPPREGESGRLGRFELLRVISEGGMGVVVEARDTLLDRRVALKLLKPELWVRNDWRARFLEEVRAMALIDHPGVLPVFEVVDTGEEVFFVMPLVEGGSLQDFLDGGGRFFGRSAVWLVEQLCAALGAVHAAGLVHGDLKPGNVLFDRERKRVWLADFGIVSSSGAVGQRAGTPEWMAPERSERPADVRSDWYEMGCLLRAAIGGRVAGWLDRLLEDFMKERPAERLADGSVVLRRIRRGKFRRRAAVVGLAAAGGVGLLVSGLSLLPAGLVGGVNRGLAEVGGGRIWIEGRIGTFPSVAQAVTEARGRRVVLDFDGVSRVGSLLLEGRGSLIAGPGRRPVVVPEKPGEVFWTVRGDWTVEGVRVERETSAVSASLIEVAAGGHFVMKRCVVWDRETVLRGRGAGSVVRLMGGAALEASDGMVFVDGRAWLEADGEGVKLVARHVVFGCGVGVVVPSGSELAMTFEDCTLVFGRFLLTDAGRVGVEARRCLFVNGVMMTNQRSEFLRWHGRGNVYQGRGQIAPGVEDPLSWSKLPGVDEEEFRVGNLPMPLRGHSGRVQLERQVIESHRGWPTDRGAGADEKRLPGRR